MLVQGYISMAAAGFDAQGMRPGMFAPAAAGLRAALLSGLPLSDAVRPLMHWYQAIVFFTQMFEDLKADGLMAFFDDAEYHPTRRTPELGARYAVPPPDIREQQALASTEVQVLVGQDPIKRAAVTSVEQQDLQQARGQHAILGGRPYGRLNLEIARLGPQSSEQMQRMRDRVK